MSGEYYCIEDLTEASNYCEGLNSNSKTNRLDNVDLNRSYNSGDHSNNSNKKSQEHHLHEIEEQLQLAEHRCNTLKSQLDFIKKSYRKQNHSDAAHSKKSCVRDKSQDKRNKSRTDYEPSSVEQNLLTDSQTQDSYLSKSGSSLTIHKEPLIFRQNSNAIGTDHSGAAIQTIHNILSGITNSVNKLSQSNCNEDCTKEPYPYVDQSCLTKNEMCTIYGTPFSPRVKKRFDKQQEKVNEIAKMTQTPITVKETKSRNKISAISIKSKDMKTKSRLKKRATMSNVQTSTKAKPVRSSVTNNDSQSLFKKRKRAIKRLKTASKVTVTRKLSESDSHLQKYNSTENLVELYHNAAARSTDSDDSTRVRKPQAGNTYAAGDVLSNAKDFSSQKPKNDTRSKFNQSENRLVPSPRLLTPIEENRTVRNVSGKHGFFEHLPKNYELPTIASKLKKVTKNYLRSLNYFNFRCIPFCAAKSTSPSHNIGINIQQVMSVIKARQPVSGISPTLAHNINLVAEKLQAGPLSAFVSNLSTRIGGGNSVCPLNKPPTNFRKLQELAQTIPEELCEEENDDHVMESNKEDTKSCAPAPVEWGPTPIVSKRCTCITKRAVPFDDILNKYRTATSMNALKDSKQDFASLHTKVPRTSYYKSPKQRTAEWVRNGFKKNSHVYDKPLDQHKKPETTDDHQQLRGKEKNLKVVLTNLHDEFDNLNNKYEKLCKNESKSNPEIVKKLEEMETQLNQKEEEINMVMSLYTEVMALKDQVKKLKERASSDTLHSSSGLDKKEINPTKHLTILLRQIQNYQNRCQNKPQV